MSSDNTIVVFETAGPEFRVAELQAAENLLSVDTDEPMSIFHEGYALWLLGDCEVFTDSNEAMIYARSLLDGAHVEYGIQVFSFPDTPFPKGTSEDGEEIVMSQWHTSMALI